MKFSKELTVGLSLVIAAVIFVLGVRYFEDLPLFGGTYALNTTFEDAGGLQSGSAVRINGVRVGAVDDVELDPETNRVRVGFHVDNDLSVPEGSFATVGGIAALGSVHMSIHLGPLGNQTVGDGGFIPGRTGGNILETMTDRAPELTNTVESVLTNANRTFEDAEVLLENANTDVRQTLLTFQQAASSLEAMIRAQQSEVTATVANLRAFSGDLSEFSDESGDSLSLAVQNLNRSLTQLEASLVVLDNSAQTLDEILTKLNTGDGTFARLVNDPSLYAKLDSSATHLNAILEDIREDPGRYLRHMSVVDLF